MLISGPAAGQPLADSHEVDMITFTGSTRTGQLIARAAVGNLKRVGLELGGEAVPEVGFGFNRRIVTGLLRDELGYDGVDRVRRTADRAQRRRLRQCRRHSGRRDAIAAVTACARRRARRPSAGLSRRGPR